VLARHEILRTRYELVGGEPAQVVDEPGWFALPAVDVAEEDVAAQVAEAATAGFDLAAEWPVRATLLRLSDVDHVLVLVLHHIACDAWSFGILAADLAEFYRGGTVDALPIQFADYAAWERTTQDGEHRRHLAHWRAELAGLLPVELVTDRPRPASRDWRGRVHRFAFPAGLADRVQRVAADRGVTVYTVLLAAWQALLARHTGQTDIPVGTMVSGRDRPELRSLIGYGVNTLVIRSRWTGDPTFDDLLGVVRDTVLTAFDHQGVPFARLVDELQPQRDTARTPLFQIAFTLQEAREQAWRLPGLDVLPVDAESTVSRFDVTLVVDQSADGSLRGELEYATALFDTATMERMGDHYLRLLDQVAADPTTRLSSVSVLGADELAVVLGQPTVDVPVTEPVHEAFERQAAAAPDAIAVTCDGRHLTYRELNAKANRIAHRLINLGARPEALVGVCLPRGLDLVPTLLGVLKSGAAYLPLDPAQPADRLAYMLSDAKVTTVVTDTGQLPTVTRVHDGDVVVVDELDERREDNPAVAVDPDNLIYVIYTSGSTGRPKGVALSHRNVLRLLLAARPHYRFTAEDVWPLFHSYAFDVSVWELWGSLLYGGRLVVVPQAVTRSPDDLLDLLVAERVTVLNQTPSAFRGLVALAGAGDPRIDRLALRAIVFAGEKLEIGELTPWLDRVGPDGPALVNMYGITEITVHATYHEVAGEDLRPGAGNPIGLPLCDLSIRLLDADGVVAPVGCVGEIWVGGPGVARGYLNRPELTAQRFVPDPYGPPGARAYRSGDLARRLPDGRLEFLGRADHQVKIRGYRVELGEIESVLSDHPAVRDAVVVLREDAPGDQRLVGYLVPEPGVAPPAPAELVASLSRDLPEYMVPAAFLVLDRIPLTANGKLDRAALPAPGRDALGVTAGMVRPRTDDERRVAAVWQEVLGVEQVGVHDNFFELGGHSIRAVAVVGALREAGFDVTVRDVFEHRSIAELAAAAATRSGPAAETSVAPWQLIGPADRAKVPDGVTDAYPLSQVQAGMVAEMLADGGRRNYHNATSFHVRDEEPFQAEAFGAAVAAVVARHEVLRTSIDLDTYSTPMQLVHATAEMPVTVHDLSALDVQAVTEELRAYGAAQRRLLFDLTRPGLLRLAVHTTADGTWWLSITECHAIIEGWSHHSLLMEVLDRYRCLRDGVEHRPDPLPALRYADFIAAELRALDSADDRKYWDGIVRDYPTMALPHGWGADDETAPPVHRLAVPFGDVEDELAALARSVGVPLKSVLLTAHLKVLSLLDGERERFHTGLVLHGRPEVAGADRVYGMFLNTLPIAFDGAAGTWADLVASVFARETEMWQHRHFPMPAIQRAAGGRRLIESMFLYLDFDQVDMDLVDYLASIDDSPTEFALGVSVRLGHVGLAVDTRVISPANAERLASLYRSVLVAMAAGRHGDPRTEQHPAEQQSPQKAKSFTSSA
ncbi:amino acid adenylation domain-containing protein, partial [Amycolatopsis sp. NPDC000740]|uniref:non-ribosomal peptide synthetase n=1 Tax=Amycolatopsis sp. NPDC000740 TaxID=3154269 RepID=UPI00332D144A